MNDDLPENPSKPSQPSDVWPDQYVSRDGATDGTAETPTPDGKRVSGDTDVSDGNPSSDTVSDRSDGSDAQTVNDEAERIEALFGTSNDDMCPVHLRPLVNGRCGLCIAHKHNKQRTAV